MNASQPSRPIAILLLSLSMAMVAFAMASLVLPGGDALPDRPDLLTVVIVAFVMLSYPFVGAILAIRRPGNPLGWLLLVLGLGFTIAFFSTDYVGRAVVSGWSLPGVVLVAWISNWGFAVDMAIGFTWIPLLFPTGHLPGPRWRPVAWAIAITMILGITASALRPGSLDAGLGTLPNPFGVEALAGVLELVESLYFPAIAALGVICVGSLFVRFWRSGAVERQQVKWFLLANAAFLVTLVIAFATVNDAAFVLALVAAAGIPIAAGIAILRYRLWDIDRIISRTVRGRYHGRPGRRVRRRRARAPGRRSARVTQAPTLAVAASTLVAFALFQPLRRRVQRVVDRRFDRARIDAERTAQGFGARLREEVAIEAIAMDLQATIDGSVRPSTQGLWLRAAGNGRRLRAHDDAYRVGVALLSCHPSGSRDLVRDRRAVGSVRRVSRHPGNLEDAHPGVPGVHGDVGEHGHRRCADRHPPASQRRRLDPVGRRRGHVRVGHHLDVRELRRDVGRCGPAGRDVRRMARADRLLPVVHRDPDLHSPAVSRRAIPRPALAGWAPSGRPWLASSSRASCLPRDRWPTTRRS